MKEQHPPCQFCQSRERRYEKDMYGGEDILCEGCGMWLGCLYRSTYKMNLEENTNASGGTVPAAKKDE